MHVDLYVLCLPFYPVTVSTPHATLTLSSTYQTTSPARQEPHSRSPTYCCAQHSIHQFIHMYQQPLANSIKQTCPHGCTHLGFSQAPLLLSAPLPRLKENLLIAQEKKRTNVSSAHTLIPQFRHMYKCLVEIGYNR